MSLLAVCAYHFAAGWNRAQAPTQNQRDDTQLVIVGNIIMTRGDAHQRTEQRQLNNEDNSHEKKKQIKKHVKKTLVRYQLEDESLSHEDSSDAGNILGDLFGWHGGNPQPHRRRNLAVIDEIFISRATFIALATSVDQFAKAFYWLQSSSGVFYGRVIVLCAADSSTCDHMNLYAQSSFRGRNVTVERLHETSVLARTSGQLLLTASFRILDHMWTAERGSTSESVVLMQTEDTQYCHNPLERLLGKSSHDIYTLTTPIWSTKIADAIQRWTVAAESKGNSTMRTTAHAQEMTRTMPHRLISANFFCGGMSVILRMLEAATQSLTNNHVRRNVPVTALLSNEGSALRIAVDKALQGSALVPLEYGRMLSPAGCNQQQECKDHGLDVVTDLSLCKPREKIDDGIHRLHWTCHASLSSRVYALHPAQHAVHVDSDLAARLPRPVLEQWDSLRVRMGNVTQPVEGAATHAVMASSPFARCPTGRQSLMIGFAWSQDPSSFSSLLQSFGKLPTLRTHCTQLVIFMRESDLWATRMSRDLLPFVSLVSTKPYEAAHQCLEQGPHICRHGVIRQWIADQLESSGGGVLGQVGLMMIFLDFLGLQTSPLVLQADPFSQMVDTHTHELQELFSDKDFLVIPASADSAAVMDYTNPSVYNARQTALRRTFGDSFAEAAPFVEMQDLASVTTSASPTSHESVPVPTPLVLGTPRAIMWHLDLLHATLVTISATAPSDASSPLMLEAASFGILTVGFRMARYPFPVYLLNPSHSPVARLGFTRAGDVRQVTEVPRQEGTMEHVYVTCDNRPYALLGGAVPTVE
jgi:hypothetical protein